MPRILVVDDDALFLRLCKEELKDEGYEVETAESGVEALAVVNKRKPDAIVLDIGMPEMDGLEVLSRVLAKDRTVPVVLNSGTAAHQADMKSWSADAYVVKTGDLAELKAAIRGVLEKRAEGG